MTTRCRINDEPVELHCEPQTRLAHALREELRLTGTKIGCDAGDCGACTVLLDDRQVCACMIPVGRLQGCRVITIEGLRRQPVGRRLIEAFHQAGAAQCGICTPGMVMAAADLLSRVDHPDDEQIEHALGGVLCRCTGYRKIIEAVQLASSDMPMRAGEGGGFGDRLRRLDGLPKLEGEAAFGADGWPRDHLLLRLLRSPHHKARFRFGDLETWRGDHPGISHVITAANIPGRNGFGIFPQVKDQPVLAVEHIRHKGEPVLAIVGEPAAVRAVDLDSIPVTWQPMPPALGLDAGDGSSEPIHEEFPDNVLARGRVCRGDVDEALRHSAFTVERTVCTSAVEHAYIEPEAGFARQVGDRVEVTAATQAPYMDRDEIAAVLGVEPERVRVIPSACGGGFGGKLDVAVQPILAVAATITGKPVGCVLSRPESMAASTKRHPARMQASMGADAHGGLTGLRFHGDFDTGAYASWGSTVASRVPVHATGPYRVQAALCTTRAIYTNGPPSGAFRGFGVPQAAVVHEAMMDDLADRSGHDRLEFRLANALRPGDTTHFGQTLESSVGLVDCLERLRPIWHAERNSVIRSEGPFRRGLGVACMWYGLGNTSISNPSSMEVGLAGDGRLTLYNGAVDIGQGTATIMVQICARALGLPVSAFTQICGDTDETLDAGKTSASRQTLVSGNAARLAGSDLRAQLLRLANAGPEADLELDSHLVRVREEGRETSIDLSRLERCRGDDVLRGFGRWDPPTTMLDADGQGVPYASYGFAAQMARVAVDIDLGRVKVEKIWAAHDAGTPINPTLCEGQIEGGIAQGLGFALMEEFRPGVNENLHDYLIPTIGDVPPIEIHLVDGGEKLGPYGAKGVGEPALIATAPAIFGAIDDAVGVRPDILPFTPDRVMAALREKRFRG